MKEKEINKLYDGNSLEIMRTAEDALERGSNRLLEIKNFARKANLKRVGIAHCISFKKEAEAVQKFMSDEFEVYSIDCKCGHITKHEMLGTEGTSIMCNPAAQAEYLKEQKTEINISMGLCVGHDMIFNRKSEAPVTALVIKDRANNHNPMVSIKSISSYQ